MAGLASRHFFLWRCTLSSVRSQRFNVASALTLFLVLLASSHLRAQDNDVRLRKLYDDRNWFELRAAVQKVSAPAFYQGAVACAFADVSTCEKKMSEHLGTKPHDDEAVEAHRILASFYLRSGKYRQAFGEVTAILSERPNDSDALGGRALLESLSRVPDEKVEGAGTALLNLANGGIPFSVNGMQATYWFDTGANLSIMSESEAKRLKLQVQDIAATMGVMTGERVGFRLAVANDLRIAFVHLKNVVFLVFPDDQAPFNQQPSGSRGLLGLPVLLGLQTFAWEGKKFEIHPKPLGAVLEAVSKADLCFDGNYPVVQVGFGNRKLAFTLDTGASNTDLYPPFASVAPEMIRTAEKTSSYKMEGVGSTKNLDAAILPLVNFTIGGFPVVLKPAGVLLKPTLETSKFFAGNLGIDLLQQAHRVTFDFAAMTLTLQ
jgi:hypothetical protein